MNVDFSASTTRDLDMSYNHLQDHFQELTFTRVLPRQDHRELPRQDHRELNGQDPRDLPRRDHQAPRTQEQLEAMALANATNAETIIVEKTAQLEKRPSNPAHDPSTVRGSLSPTPSA